MMASDVARYRIVVEGELDDRFGHFIESTSIVRSHGVTTIEGEIADQAALQGLLDRVADLGLVLLSVSRLGDGVE
jgi:hypothetical protein